jgi:hypothetical protein
VIKRERCKRPLANAARYGFVISSANVIVEISGFLEMKIEAVTFKVYINCNCGVSKNFHS